MCSKKATSSKSPAGKRGSDKTKDKNSKSPPSKKEKGQSSRDKGQSSRDKGQASHDKEREHGRCLDVYVCKFQTLREGADYHRYLFVALRKEESRFGEGEISRGNVYEVEGPAMNVAKSGSEYKHLFQKEKAPQHSLHFKGMKKIGQVAAHRVDRIREVCSSVTPPSGPPKYKGRPDCNDWLHNVIYRLHQQRIIDFELDFVAPTAEVSLTKRSRD